MTSSDRVSHDAIVIGGGHNGLVCAALLAKNGRKVLVLEASDEVGGNWYFKNPNGMSACYQSLHIDTSKFRLAFEDYPAPAGWPDCCCCWPSTTARRSGCCRTVRAMCGRSRARAI